jgi:O-glycosyl hydrolase
VQVGSPWSPPAWMKVPVDGAQSMLGSAAPDGLLPEFHATWARYLSLWVSAYEGNGVPVWGLTAQNEAEYAGEVLLLPQPVGVCVRGQRSARVGSHRAERSRVRR